MLTKKEILEEFAKKGNCNSIECKDCPWNSRRCCYMGKELKRIGAMAILRQNRKNKSKRRVFNPDKILTCVTADKARVGMKGYFGDDLAGIKRNFENNNLYELLGIYDESCTYRFENKYIEYALFYPIDEEEE